MDVSAYAIWDLTSRAKWIVDAKRDDSALVLHFLRALQRELDRQSPTRRPYCRTGSVRGNLPSCYFVAMYTKIDASPRYE